MIESRKKEEIAIVVISILNSRFEKFPFDTSNNRYAPFNEMFLHPFSDNLELSGISDIHLFIALCSWSHGLSTSLGTFYESVAHILSGGKKVAYTTAKKNRLKITSDQNSKITSIITELKNGERNPDVDYENSIIRDQNNPPTENASDFTVDVFLDKGTDIVAIELKSVKPNIGEMQNEKRKILQAKAALSHLFPGKNIKYFIGFPFDPTGSELIKSDKERFLNNLIDGNKFISTKEILLSEELWDYLSDYDNTTQQILEIIENICTKDFKKNLLFINDYNNRINDPEEYRNLLEKWCLFKEMEIFDKNSIILDKIMENKVSENYEQKVLKVISNGIKYNEARYIFLKRIIDKKTESNREISGKSFDSMPSNKKSEVNRNPL